MVPVVLVFLVVFQVSGPEIRILQEISSPKLAGNLRKTRFRPKKGLPRVVVVLVVPRVGSGTGGPPGGFWYWNGLNPEWLTPEWVLVLVLVVLVVVLVVLAVVS